jgi:MFS family permease
MQPDGKRAMTESAAAEATPTGDSSAAAPPGVGRRSRIPPFILELGEAPGALPTLIAASLAVAAAGLDPKVFSSGMPDAQAALHQKPELESAFLLLTMIATAFTLLGGLLGDLMRRRRLLVVGLALMVVGELISAFAPFGPVFSVGRVITAIAVGIILPVALAMVAVTYTGGARATALGIAYAGLGATSALWPAILGATRDGVGRWPAFVLAAAAALICIPIVRRHALDPVVGGLRIRDAASHGLWALGLLAITGGATGFRADPGSAIRIGLVVGGIVLVVVFLAWQHLRELAHDDAAIDVRPVTVALIAGVVIAVAQTAPAVQAPIYFQVVDGMSPLLATIAIAPFVLALLVSGPVAGLLLSRYSPRMLIVGGLALVGLGDILFSLAGPGWWYPWFIVPFAAVGAGFVVGTCVRTAVIFAGVPRKLPATAAALNQSSLMVGSQIGVAAVTAIVSDAALTAFTRSPDATTAPDPTGAIAAFTSFLDAIGTTTMGEAISSLDSSLKAGYAAAYAAGVSQALATVGTAALLAAAICWFAMGHRAPLTSVWEHRDERPEGATTPAPAT